MNFLLRKRRLGRTSCNQISALSRSGISVVRNDATIPDTSGFVFRWGTTNTLPGHPKVVNTAEAIHWASNKRESRLALQTAGVSVPQTWYAEAFRGDVIRGLGPSAGLFVLRPAHHAQGRQLVHGDTEAIMAAINQPLYANGYVARLINKVSEFRVFVSQGRAVWVAKKTPGNPSDVAWNVARGGRFDNVGWDAWPLKAVKESIKAMAVSGLDFGGVDVMLDADGNVYILEINSAPSQTSPYRQSCVAKAFDWIIEKNSKATIPIIEARGGYKKFIHPCLTEEAILL